MENIDHRNTLAPDAEPYGEYEFKYNFINIPWGERTKKSKISAVLLLLAIFLATFACVINGFLMHYRGIDYSNYQRKGTKKNFSAGVNCQLVRVEDYRFVAGIHSLTTRQLICIGAVISDTAVLTNGGCVKSAKVIVHVGNPVDVRCKNGFSVKTVEVLLHEGVVGKELFILITNKTMKKCAKIIQISTDDVQKRAFVIGRSLNGNPIKTFSRQPVEILGTGTECDCTGLSVRKQPNIICVKSLVQCPILAGDLLVDGGSLYGLASSNLYRRTQLDHVCFADLKMISANVY